jgi:hypothetical protein
LPCRVVTQGEASGIFDYQVPAMSLAGELRVTPSTVPAPVPYITPPDEKVRQWAARLRKPDDKPKVAIACSGRATHRHEGRRRVRVHDFAGLDRLVHLFLLQKEINPEDRIAIEEGSVAVDFLGDEIVDFRDGAGIIANVDLVISVDTSIGHLAGAMARPVWLLLAGVPDWRWMLERTDTPWYPTMRLFRQERAGDWSGVFTRMREAIREFTPRDRGSD